MASLWPAHGKVYWFPQATTEILVEIWSPGKLQELPKAKRCSQWDRNRSGYEQSHDQYKEMRKKLHAAIIESKSKHLKWLRKETNSASWNTTKLCQIQKFYLDFTDTAVFLG